MTEYDFSPEAYERYLATQNRIAKWVEQIDQHKAEFENPIQYLVESSDDERPSDRDHRHCRKEKHSKRSKSRHSSGTSSTTNSSSHSRTCSHSYSKEKHPRGPPPPVPPPLPYPQGFAIPYYPQYAGAAPVAVHTPSGSPTAYYFPAVPPPPVGAHPALSPLAVPGKSKRKGIPKIYYYPMTMPAAHAPHLGATPSPTNAAKNPLTSPLPVSPTTSASAASAAVTPQPSSTLAPVYSTPNPISASSTQLGVPLQVPISPVSPMPTATTSPKPPTSKHHKSASSSTMYSQTSTLIQHHLPQQPHQQQAYYIRLPANTSSKTAYVILPPFAHGQAYQMSQMPMSMPIPMMPLANGGPVAYVSHH